MKRKIWDIKEFKNINLPEVVGFVDPTTIPFNKIRILDMPIFMPDQGWSIPNKIVPFLEIILQSISFEKKYGYFDHYVYITIDQKQVLKGNTGRRAGAHSDAYLEHTNQQYDITTENVNVIKNCGVETSHTYIWASSIPTEFFNVPFPLETDSDEESLKTFDEIANSSNPITFPVGTILKLDPYVVHRCGISKTTHNRTFVKISISKKKYARIGNTINSEFNYSWEMTARSPEKRNSPW